MYLFDFIKRSYGIISFGDVMLGDAIDDASKKLTPFYDEVEEKFSRIIPTIKGKLVPFDDKYIMYEHVELSGNPITSIEIRVHFQHYPYSSISCLEGMESHIAEKKYMEVIITPKWKENDQDALHQIERRVHMQNILYDYYSYIGISDSGYTTIGIKIELPKHNLREATEDSVWGTYSIVNTLLRNYEKNLKLLEAKGNTIIFPHRSGE